jgi:hypothetical protein
LRQLGAGLETRGHRFPVEKELVRGRRAAAAGNRFRMAAAQKLREPQPGGLDLVAFRRDDAERSSARQKVEGGRSAIELL